MAAHDEMKALKKRISEAEAEANLLNEDIKTKQRSLSDLRNNIKRMNQRLDDLTPKQITVTDHARLRYLERTLGDFTTEAIDKAILTEQLVTAINTLGNGRFPLGNGLSAVVKDNTIITIY